MHVHAYVYAYVYVHMRAFVLKMCMHARMKEMHQRALYVRAFVRAFVRVRAYVCVLGPAHGARALQGVCVGGESPNQGAHALRECARARLRELE